MEKENRISQSSHHSTTSPSLPPTPPNDQTYPPEKSIITTTNDPTSSPSTTPLPREATPSELSTHPHITAPIPLSAWLVILAGAFERATYFGIIAPWQNYMQNPRSLDRNVPPGALGLGQSTATNVSNAFFLFSYLTPMLFACVSDMWLGRYRTLMVGLGIYMLGCIILLCTSLPVALDHGAGIGGLVAAMILIGLGVGAVKAIYFPFLGDQYVQKKPQLVRQKNGELAIVDGTRTLQLIYNLYFWFTNVAALSTIATTFLEKEYDFWTAYLLCTACLLVTIVVLLVCSGKLVKLTPKGNNLPMATKVLVCASKNGFKLNHAKASYQQEHKNKRVLWSDGFIDELKLGLLACRVIFSYLLFYLCINQIFNNLVSQAGQMELHGIPNDMIQSFSGVACVIFGPIIQAMYSFLAKRRIAFGPIARISAAFFFCGAGMAYAAGIQKLIYTSGPCYDQPFACEASDGKPNDVNVWVQVPIYFILAVAEIFGFVTASEYAYSKSPQDMKTIVQAISQLTACLGSALGMALSPVAKDPYLVTLYACLAATMGVATAVFWWIFRRYDKIDEELNQSNLKSSEDRDHLNTPSDDSVPGS
ncbi:oligopeptide transporter [Aulographum hederae CBS 113979]|uniref:Oligopeptide transporter n=1 Tax=Aulographum hederae CBS 113979 TaxID=1176131 RepID=A0A6G1GTM2_9PEZI|nr:oligopeptide transporter [Aulographum hederae CBS 113979]